MVSETSCEYHCLRIAVFSCSLGSESGLSSNLHLPVKRSEIKLCHGIPKKTSRLSRKFTHLFNAFHSFTKVSFTSPAASSLNLKNLNETTNWTIPSATTRKWGFPAMEDYNKRQTRRAWQMWWRTLRSCWCGTLPLFLLVSSWIFLISFLLCRILINKETNKQT